MRGGGEKVAGILSPRHPGAEAGSQLSESRGDFFFSSLSFSRRI